jgi:hypothetical protein
VLKAFSRYANVPDARRILDPHQLRFLEPRGNFRTNCSGRRAGKTFSILIWLVEQWRSRPGQCSAFLALTVEHARRIGWEQFRELNQRMGWGFEEHTVKDCWVAPNGFTLYYGGAKDRPQANRWRGIPKMHRVCVDECGQYPETLLKYLIEDCLEPALMDTNGDLAMVGTPSDVGVGFYEDRMQLAEKLGMHFCATVADNTHLTRPGAEILAEVLREKFKGDATNVTYRREYLGHRIADAGVIIYKPGAASILYASPPDPRNLTYMGIDIGWHDGFGFSVVRTRAPLPGVHVLRAFAQSEIMLGRAAAIAEGLRREHNVAQIFVDTAGGGGRTLAETLSGEYGLPCTSAKAGHKEPRKMRIEKMRNALAGGYMTCAGGDATRMLEDEWKVLPWADATKMDHRPGYADECTDATQYASLGSGIIWTTTWEAEKTSAQLHQERIEQIRRERAQARSAGRRRRR